jgi:enoyl-CoA hydratase/carnithine racemase
MAEVWHVLREWPELVLERLEDAGVARIILNRPDKRNCLNKPLVAAFFEALDIIRADRDLKVVITKGAGSAYSSGLDLNFLRAMNSGAPRDWDRASPTIRLAETLRVFPRITIAQVPDQEGHVDAARRAQHFRRRGRPDRRRLDERTGCRA